MSDSIITKLKVEGMHCAACVKLIQKRLANLVDTTIQKLDISGELELAAPRVVTVEEVNRALEGTEYSAQA